ncbi:carbonic anhydrase [Gymnopilus junonius]|uniref:Carbonic anhydrase n=1 Tax=Gymnopilus junonius TaxID=109634 RepID=A0A9P5NV06_GYMJU|nr:carbonic anhydrase [Gymnopilus junonius]
MSAHETFAAHNDKYITSFDKATSSSVSLTRSLSLVIACMDARIDPATQIGLDLGDAHILRNGGASAREALRSIIISQRLLGTREVAIIHHTDCGMFTFTNESLRTKVKSEAPGNTAVAHAVNDINFLAAYANLDESVEGDVKFLKESSLLAEGTVITGWVHDTATGKVMNF